MGGDGKWPMRIEVGDRVHQGVSSPDTGIVLSITKNRRRAQVKWDKNGISWRPLRTLFSVTKSLTSWALFVRGERPCACCGYRVWEPRRRLCNLCLGVPVGERRARAI